MTVGLLLKVLILGGLVAGGTAGVVAVVTTSGPGADGQRPTAAQEEPAEFDQTPGPPTPVPGITPRPTAAFDPCQVHDMGTQLSTMVLTDTGETVYECQPLPGQHVWIYEDGTQHTWHFSFEEAERYYAQHPDELPANKNLERFQQEWFVTPDLPHDLTAPCPADWADTVSQYAQSIICHPSGWKVFSEDENGIVLGPGESWGRGPVEVAVVAPGSPGEVNSAVTICAEPQIIATAQGDALACARLPEYWGRGYGLILANGRHVHIGVYTSAEDPAFRAATPSEVEAALTVAANVQALQ